MQTVNIHAAKTHLSKLIERAFLGEEVVICKLGKPMVRLIKYAPQTNSRVPGQWQGKVSISSDFDVLPKNMKNMFNGEEDI